MMEMHAIADNRHGQRHRLSVDTGNPEEVGEMELEVWLASLRAEGWTVIRSWTADTDTDTDGGAP